MLALDPEAREFNLAFGATPTNDKEIAMVTRSILEILAEASGGVEVPAADVEEGRATKTTGAIDLGGAGKRVLVRVRSSADKPSPRDAHVVIRYREKWFWVDRPGPAVQTGLGFPADFVQPRRIRHRGNSTRSHDFQTLKQAPALLRRCLIQYLCRESRARCPG